MVTCPNCGHPGENEKFCSNCGAPLNEEQSTTSEAVESTTATATNQAPKEPNEAVEKLKENSMNYFNLLFQLIKHPSSAKHLTERDFISGLITIGVFTLIMTLFYYIDIAANSNNADFFDYFIKPFVAELIWLFVVPAVIFGALFLFKGVGSFPLVLAKFGGYLVPFIAIFVVGEVFSLLDIDFLASITSTISKTGVMLIIPAVMLFEDGLTENSFDLVYVLFIAVALILLVDNLVVDNMYSSLPMDYGYNDYMKELENWLD